MTKRDLKKERRALYTAPKDKPALVVVPPMHFLMIDGQGQPGEAPAFMEAVETLIRLSYTIRAEVKDCGGTDFTVMPLEGLWWDMKATGGPRWTLMVMQPEWVSQTVVDNARCVLRKKECCTPAMERVRFEIYEEGPSLQILHVGPYDQEEPTLRLLREAAEAGGYLITGRHHEIYLGDPRRAAPEKLRTILRHGVRSAEE
jgi:hypothetical protein